MDYFCLEFPESYFDAVIDICSIQHNPISNVPTIMNQIRKVLKPGSKLFSIVVAEGSEPKTFADKGHVHFYKLDEIKKLWGIFPALTIEKTERTANNRKDRIIHWLVTSTN